VSVPIVVGSVQTLARPNRLEQLDSCFNTIIVDEAHHAVADSYQRILEHVGAFAPGALRWSPNSGQIAKIGSCS
jgi:superfamily II DNA or RNA helicase